MAAMIRPTDDQLRSSFACAGARSEIRSSAMFAQSALCRRGSVGTAANEVLAGRHDLDWGNEPISRASGPFVYIRTARSRRPAPRRTCLIAKFTPWSKSTKVSPVQSAARISSRVDHASSFIHQQFQKLERLRPRLDGQPVLEQLLGLRYRARIRRSGGSLPCRRSLISPCNLSCLRENPCRN